MEAHVIGTLSATGILWRLGLALLLVLTNAFFVAAEFSLVGARHTRIATLAASGHRTARLADHAIGHLDHYLSATQLGINLASLGLGWVGESTLAAILIQWFGTLPAPWSAIATHTVAGALAFVLITVMHIVLGELAPKSLAILFPEGLALWTAIPLVGFTRVFAPFIYALNGLANLILRALGLKPPHEAERVHRPEEIEMLLRQSYESGLLAKEPVEMIRGIFDLSETTAGEVMTPRTEMVALPVDTPLDEAAREILDAGHSRLPVYEDSVDRIAGIVLARDVWRARREGGERLSDLVRPAAFVPDSKTVEDLLRDMQRDRIHMAIVVDEFGGTAGLVTLEDLVEEIVGEIRDEHEDEVEEILETGAGALLAGSAPVADVNERFSLSLPEEDYTTMAGYVMGRLGRIARRGDTLTFDGGRLRVISMNGRRVTRLALTLQSGSGVDDAGGS
ncbi:MAG: hemolysin family protein [Gemmatimonadota bacterium]